MALFNNHPLSIQDHICEAGMMVRDNHPLRISGESRQSTYSVDEGWLDVNKVHLYKYRGLEKVFRGHRLGYIRFPPFEGWFRNNQHLRM
eukprot:scaffold5504_cov102-Cylindrotheca_fusiformis.AAC.2